MVTVSKGWAVKHRPLKFEHVVGQTAVVDNLRGMLARQEVPNAILFCGPRGTGKTTLARIFARYLNCLTTDACGTCPSCVAMDANRHQDVLELNAATKRGIDDIRELTTLANYRPKHAVRVIIVDEAHQFTAQAMQAFLKPLEEPPANTLYMLCTTDPQKFPETLLDRCLRLDLGLPERGLIARRLGRIAKLERLAIPKEVLLAMAEASGGHVRNAVTILESAANTLAANPKATETELITVVNVNSEAVNADLASQLLVAMYANKPQRVAAAVFGITDVVATLNTAINLNQYVIGKTVAPNTTQIWHSPINRAHWDAATRKELSLETLLAAQKKLVQLRNDLYNTPTQELSMLLAYLT